MTIKLKKEELFGVDYSIISPNEVKEKVLLYTKSDVSIDDDVILSNKKTFEYTGSI